MESSCGHSAAHAGALRFFNALVILSLYAASNLSALPPHLHTSLPFNVFSTFGAQGSAGGGAGVVGAAPAVVPIIATPPVVPPTSDPNVLEKMKLSRSTGAMPFSGSSHGPSSETISELM